MTVAPPGSIRVHEVSRRFRVIHERHATLKEAILRRGHRSTHTEFWAVRGVNLDIQPGEAVGIVGRNGSGKSTLLKMLAGIIPPQQGTVQTTGSVASLLELGSGFHPDFTGRENVFMNGAIHGLSERDVRVRLDAIVEFAELTDFIDMPVRTYSSGMQMRLAFAVASHVNPDVLLLDEVLAVGDEAFQRKCMGRIFDFRRGGGTLVFVSHDPNAVEQVCDRAILMDHGVVVADGLPSEVMVEYHRLLGEQSDRRIAPDDDDIHGDTSTAGPAFSIGGWGTGEITMTTVGVMSRGEPITSVVCGDELTIELRIDVRESVDNPIAGISIEAEDGTVLYGTNTGLDHISLGRLTGTSVICFRIPALPLHAGTFAITAAIHSEDLKQVYHWVDRAATFTVFPRRAGIGLVEIAGDWEIEDSDTGGRQ